MSGDSSGTEIERREFEGIRISETIIQRGVHLQNHSHPSGQICFVLEGAYRERVGERERLLEAGMMHVRGPGAVHANSFPYEAVLVLLISIEPRRWIEPLVPGPIPLFDELAAELRSEIRRGGKASQPALEDLAMRTLSRVAGATVDEKAEPQWVRHAASTIEHRFQEPLSLASVARAVGVSPFVLARAFRRHRGMAVGEAIRRTRVRHAVQALLQSHASIARIAFENGFHDQAHLTRVFRSITGMTPGRYRSRLSAT